MVCITINTGNKIGKIIKKFHSPQQRLFLGVTALPCLSFYDYFISPDEQTKKASLSKTWAKIIAGTLTGFTVRKAGIKFVENFAKAKWKPVKNTTDAIITKDDNEMLSFLYPKSWLGRRQIAKDEFENEKDKYVKNLGTYVAIAVMLVTNFLVDAPLTVYLTNFFREKVFKLNEQKIPDENFMRYVIKQSGFCLKHKGGQE